MSVKSVKEFGLQETYRSAMVYAETLHLYTYMYFNSKYRWDINGYLRDLGEKSNHGHLSSTSSKLPHGVVPVCGHIACINIRINIRLPEQTLVCVCWAFRCLCSSTCGTVSVSWVRPQTARETTWHIISPTFWSPEQCLCLCSRYGVLKSYSRLPT